MKTTLIQSIKKHRAGQLATLAHLHACRNKLLRACAANEEVDPQEVNDICDVLCIEPDEWLAMVETLERRIAAAAALAEAPLAAKRGAEVEAELKAADAEYGAAVKAAGAKRDYRKTELNTELTALLATSSAAIEAETLLRHSFDQDPRNKAVLDQERVAINRGQDLQRKICDLEFDLRPGGCDDAGLPTLANRAGAAAQAVREDRARPNGRSADVIRADKATAERLAKEVAEVERQIAGLKREKQKVDDELSRFSALRLAP